MDRESGRPLRRGWCVRRVRLGGDAPRQQYEPSGSSGGPAQLRGDRLTARSPGCRPRRPDGVGSSTCADVVPVDFNLAGAAEPEAAPRTHHRHTHGERSRRQRGAVRRADLHRAERRSDSGTAASVAHGYDLPGHGRSFSHGPFQTTVPSRACGPTSRSAAVAAAAARGRSSAEAPGRSSAAVPRAALVKPAKPRSALEESTTLTLPPCNSAWAARSPLVSPASPRRCVTRWAPAGRTDVSCSHSPLGAR